MGILLKEAEMLSINHHLEDASDVLDLLKQSKFWPKSAKES